MKLDQKELAAQLTTLAHFDYCFTAMAAQLKMARQAHRESEKWTSAMYMRVIHLQRAMKFFARHKRKRRAGGDP